MVIEGVEKIKRSTLSEDVISRIKYMIENNDIKPGEKFPAERELASMFGVGRSSVREALRVLQTIGALDRRQGIGTYLNIEAKQSLKRADFTVEKYTFMEMAEARKIIEVQSVEVAALRADAADIRAMETACRKHTQMARSDLLSEITVLDYNFHRAVAQGTHNSLLLGMFDILKGILISSNYAVLTKERVAEAVSYHRQIVLAIKAHNRQRAKKIMEEHLSHVEKNIIKSYESDEEEKHDRKRAAAKRVTA